MPNVYLTEQDRENARTRKIREVITDGVVAQKHKNRLTIPQLAAEFGLGRAKASRLLTGDETLDMNIDQFIRLLRWAGFKIVRVKEDTFHESA